MREDTVLGKKIASPDRYSPDILVAVKRSENRRKYGIDANNFVGYDVWHGYEISCLTENGLPEVGIMKMVVPANSEYLIESKSLKLYLNSLNMERIGIEEMKKRIIKDISERIGSEVKVNIFGLNEKVKDVDFLSDYKLLENEEFARDIIINHYTETVDILEKSEGKTELNAYTNLLRSNCKITHQPDWGSVFVRMKGKEVVSEESLLRYIVSLRCENHFHEEICELIYKRLCEKFDFQELLVLCIYTRRGGIDICPVRASNSVTLPDFLTDETKHTHKLIRQ